MKTSLSREVASFLERYDKCFRKSSLKFPAFVPLEAHGAVIRDIEGKEYLDFSTVSAIVGHSHPNIVDAIKRQVEKLTQFGDGIPEPRLKLAENLKEIAPFGLRGGKTVFGCSGTEIVEFALKLVKYHTKRPVIVSYIGGHHGRSPGVMPFTTDYSRSKLHHTPNVIDAVYVPYPFCYHCILGQVYPDCSLACLDYLRHTLDQVVPPEAVASILMEPLLSWSGFVIPPPSYLPKLRELCDEHGILLVDDEVFTGFGRTGRMFAIEHFGVEPDVLCMGKAMGGGTPLSALLAKKEMIDQWETGLPRTSSSAGNILACASFLATLEIIREEKLEKKAEQSGNYLMSALKGELSDSESVGDIRGMGLLIGIELVKKKDRNKPNPQMTKRVFRTAFEKGVLLNQIAGTYHHIVRIVAPLTVTKDQLDRLIEVLCEVLRAG